MSALGPRLRTNLESQTLFSPTVYFVPFKTVMRNFRGEGGPNPFSKDSSKKETSEKIWD